MKAATLFTCTACPRTAADEAIDGPQPVACDEAENRMHTGNALMALTIGAYAEGGAR